MKSKILLVVFAFLAVVQPATGQTFTGTGGTIPNDNTQQCFPLAVSGVGNLTNVQGLTQVCLTINHPFDADLDIYLKSPSGALYMLSTDNGFGANYTNTCFTASATTNIANGMSPFTGSFLPEQSFFSINNGQSGDGTWQLCITDDQPFISGPGTLVSWSLTFGTPPPNGPPPCLNNPAPADLCTSATPVCNLNGFCGTTSAAYNADTWPALTSILSSSCNMSIQNNSWLQFKASSTSISFNVWVFNSTQNQGIQIVVMNAACSGPVTLFYCNGTISPTGNTPLTVNVSGLVPGTDYFIMIDGQSGDVCDYVINANSGFSVLQITPSSDTICAGTSVSLTASGGQTGYTWTPSAGLNTTTGATVVATPAATTTYMVHSQTSLFTCPDSTTATITVNPAPAAPAASSPVTYCQGATATALTATGSNLLWYTAATGGTGTATAPAPSTATPGTTTWYVSQTVNGCESPRSPISVIVNPAMAGGTTAQICPGGSYPFGSQTITAAGTYTETFTAANGCDSVVTLTMTVGNTIQVNIAQTICQGESVTFNGTVYTNAGSYSYTTASSGGCDSVTTLNLTVNPNVTPTFTAIAPICSGATAPVLPATSNNGITGTWNPATVSNTATGTYTFTPNAGQCAATTTLTVTVNPNVTPTFTAIAPICQGATAPVLPATSNNGITGTWNPATVSNTATGTYTFTPDAGQCATTATITVTVNPAVTATQAITVCAAQLPYPWNGQSLTAAGTYTHTQANANGCDSTTTLTFTVNPTINTTQAVTICETQLPYPWNGQNLTASGTYTHTQPNAAGCDSMITLTFTVNNQVTPAFTAIAPICSGATAPVLPATSNNGITGTWSPATVSNAATGTYTFSPNAGQCATATSLTVTVNPNVTPAFTAIAPICQGAAAPILPATSSNGITGTWNPSTVSNTATGTYTFTPDAGQCATTATITVTVDPTVTATEAITVCAAQLPYPWNGQSLTAAGTYTHTQANANGCDSTTTLTFTVNPTINTTQAVTVCETELPYPWNGQSLTASGTYTHTQPNAAGCDSTMTLTFTVNSQVTPAFTAIAPICNGATAPVLPATSNNGIAGTWNPATVSNTATGTYTFSPNAGQCATATSLTVTVNPLPAAPVVTTPVSYCQDALAMPLSAAGNNLLWYTTATGGTGIATAPTPSTTTAGTTTWYVSQSANGCEGPRAAIVVTVRPTPAAPSVSSPVAYCLGEAAAALSAAGSSLLWYTTATGGNGTTTAPTPQTATPGATTWYVSQTIDGCEGPRAALTVIIHPLPPAPEVSSPVNYCQGDATTPLTAEGNGLLWYTEASGGMASSIAPVPSSDAPGTQSWYVSQTENGCEGPRTRIEVIVHPNPTLDAKLDIVGTTMYLDAQATGTGLTYMWTPPDGLSCTDCDRPRADPERNTVYTVTVTTAAGCSASDTVGVYLDCNKVFIPNTFSPNGDGNNDRFYPIGLSLKQIKVFRVYNRWGELLFSRDNVPANDPLYGWDGNYQSKTVKPDVFVYYLEAICITGELISRKGDVAIIR